MIEAIVIVILLILLARFFFLSYTYYRVMEHIYWRHRLGVPYLTDEVTGYIYGFIDPTEPDFVKWGRAKDWRQRMKQHQTANPVRLDVICVVGVRDDVFAEAEVHDLFIEQAVTGEGGGREWFINTPKMLRWARLVTDPGLDRENW